MGLVGLWHGAGWGYVLWGLMHGVYLVIFRRFGGTTESNGRLPVALFWRIFTLVAITAAWIPFRAASLGQAATMLSSMFWRFTPGMSYSVNFYLVTLMWCTVCVAEPYLAKLIQSVEHLSNRSPSYGSMNAYLLRPLSYACLLLIFIVFDDRDMQFIYFQF
jgi:hypothetical protein